MSKTLYADGQTGKVAIMKGEFSQTVLDNPQANTDKLYFHSELNYLISIGEMSGSFNLPSKSKTLGSDTTIVDTLSFPSGYTPVIFTYLNGLPMPDVTLVYNSQSSSDINYNLRFLTPLFTLSSSTLSLIVGNQYIAKTLPAYSGTLSAKVYGYKSLFTESETIFITPQRCISSRGKFDSNNKYAKLAGDYPVYGNSPAFTFSKPSTGYIVNAITRTPRGGLEL